MPASRAALASSVEPPMSWLWLAAAALYPLSGLAAWLVWRRIDIGLERKRSALRCWGWQLLLGGLWPAAFYSVDDRVLSLTLLGAMLLAASVTWRAFRRLQRAAAALLLPYCAWVVCAAVIVADRF